MWSGDTENTLHENKLLEGLQPHTSIEKLSIFGYGGTRFADLVGQATYSNIVSLKLHGCKNCFSFPSLELSSLVDLSISNFDSVEEVCMKAPLNSLKTLNIENMKQWQRWIFSEGNDSEKCGSLVKLENLRIENCPELKFISRCGPTHMIFESLNSLKVKGCSPSLNATSLLATINFKQLMLKNKPPNRSCTPEWMRGFHCGRSKLKLEQLSYATYDLSISNVRVEGLEEISSAWNALEDIRIRFSESIECIPLEACPVLKSLNVESCGGLKFLSACGVPLPNPLMSLTYLSISKCRSLLCFPEGGISAPNLTYLKLWECSSLKSLPEGMHHLLPSLEKLSIRHCEELESFPEGGFPTKLKSVEIWNCKDKGISGVLQWDFPHETLLLPSSLTSLVVNDFKNLKYINSKAIQHLTELSISGCPNLRTFQEGGLPSSISNEIIEDVGTESSLGGGNLKSLSISQCDKLICSRLQWGMQRFNALSRLILSYYKGDDLDSFPEELLLPSTLTSLEIWNFKNLKGINYKGLQHLTSLFALHISYCPNLQFLPQGLPSSISNLYIIGCPLLEKRCKREIGEDWPKISHIPHIYIDWYSI